VASIVNLSSASALFVAADFLEANGMLLALGVAFCAELVLIQW